MTKDEQRRAAIDWLRGEMTRRHMAAWLYSFDATQSDMFAHRWRVDATSKAGDRVACTVIVADGEARRSSAIILC